MKKHITALFFIFMFFYSFSQSSDSLPVKSFINFNRPRGIGEIFATGQIEERNISVEGDTLVRTFDINREFPQVLSETSYLHGKKNGLAVSYFQNGLVKEINYYLNDRIWSVFSRADSSGRLLFPGTLHNGNGTKYFSDNLGYEPNCYITFKNGLPEGAYYCQLDEGIQIKGELTWRKSEVRYRPAKKVTFIDNFSGEKATMVFDTIGYRSIFLNDHHNDYKILSVSDDSLEESVKIYKFINVGFGDDPATIPKGTWLLINTKNGHLKMEVRYDDHGNAVSVKTFNENGEIMSEKKYPSYNRRQW
jgi:antitoxin component YwqK of YwqJK toxin-antitoxin module